MDSRLRHAGMTILISEWYYKIKFEYTIRPNEANFLINNDSNLTLSSYRAYLNKALKEDWGLAIEEDEKRKQKIIKEQEVKNRQEQEALKQQRELHCQVKEYMKTLSPEELETLREEAIGRLDEEAKKNAEKFDKLELLVRMVMEEIIGEQLKASQCQK